MPPATSDNDISDFHIQVAKENYERYQRLLQNNLDIDWALIALFYCAVHLVQAHAAMYAPRIPGERVPVDHKTRNHYAANRLPEIFDAYALLKNVSEDARYDGVKRTREEVVDLHNNFFEPIKSRLARRKINW